MTFNERILPQTFITVHFKRQHLDGDNILLENSNIKSG